MNSENTTTARNETLTEQSSSLAAHCESEPIEEKSSIAAESGKVSTTELDDAKAEIEFLEKELAKSNTAIDKLEDFVRTLTLKQNEYSSLTHKLRNENVELQDECKMLQDEYTMERNDLSRELSCVNKLLDERTKKLEESLQHKEKVNSAVLAGKAKMDLIEIELLKLKSSISSRVQQPSSSADNAEC